MINRSKLEIWSANPMLPRPVVVKPLSRKYKYTGLGTSAPLLLKMRRSGAAFSLTPAVWRSVLQPNNPWWRVQIARRFYSEMQNFSKNIYRQWVVWVTDSTDWRNPARWYIHILPLNYTSTWRDLLPAPRPFIVVLGRSAPHRENYGWSVIWSTAICCWRKASPGMHTYVVFIIHNGSRRIPPPTPPMFTAHQRCSSKDRVGHTCPKMGRYLRKLKWR